MSGNRDMTTLVRLTRLWLGSLFVYSAGLKFAYYDHVGDSVVEYGLLPRRVAVGAGWLLPWIELLAGTSLLSARLYPFGHLLAIGLGTSFSGSSYVVLRSKAEIPCGCTGRSDDRVSGETLARGLGIVLCALLSLCMEREPKAEFGTARMLGIVGVFLLPGAWAASWRVRHHRAYRRKSKQTEEIINELTRVLAARPSGATAKRDATNVDVVGA